MGKLANPKKGREAAAMAEALRQIPFDSGETVWVTFKGKRLKLAADGTDLYPDNFFNLKTYQPAKAIIANRGKYHLVELHDHDGLRAYWALEDNHSTVNIQYKQIRAWVIEEHDR